MRQISKTTNFLKHHVRTLMNEHKITNPVELSKRLYVSVDTVLELIHKIADEDEK